MAVQQTPLRCRILARLAAQGAAAGRRGRCVDMVRCGRARRLDIAEEAGGWHSVRHGVEAGTEHRLLYGHSDLRPQRTAASAPNRRGKPGCAARTGMHGHAVLCTRSAGTGAGWQRQERAPHRINAGSGSHRERGSSGRACTPPVSGRASGAGATLRMRSGMW